MNIINNIINNKLVKDSIYFKMVFISWALLHSLTFGQYITGYFSVPIIIWGGFIVFKNIFNDKSHINRGILLCIYAFLASYVLTIILNRQSNLVGNVKTLIWQVIMLIGLFIYDNWKTKEELKKEIILISKTIISITSVFVLCSLIIFFLNINYSVNRVDGVVIPLGYRYARLWGIFVDPNQAAVIAIISMLASGNVLISGGIKKKGFIIFNIIIQYIFLVLTASRGGNIAFIFTLISIGYLSFDFLFKKGIKRVLLRRILGIAIGTILAIIIVFSAVPTRNLLVAVPNHVARIRNEIKGDKEINDNIDVERNDLSSSNGRAILWKDGFKLSSFSPIVGFGDRNISIKAKDLTPGSSLIKKTVHNGFIHMMLSGGLIAVSIMLILISLIGHKAIKVFFINNRYNSEFYLTNLISIAIGVLLITTMFLTEIFYQNSFAATIFWIYLGYFCGLENIIKKRTNTTNN